MRGVAAVLAACFALAVPVAAEEFPIEYVHGGPSLENRVHIMIAGDGYTADDLATGKFKQVVQSAVDSLLKKAPYSTWKEAIVISRVDVASKQSGFSSQADCSIKDTYFKTWYQSNPDGKGGMVDSHRSWFIDGNPRTVDRVHPKVPRDVFVVLMNDNRHAGMAGGKVIVTTAADDLPDVLHHELGHAYGGLTDEYSGGNAPSTTEYPNPNATLNPDKYSVKWNDWVRALPGTIGCFEGVAHSSTGAYRPAAKCVMLDNVSDPCAVCLEAMYFSLMTQVSLIERPSPANGKAGVVRGESASFSANVLSPSSMGRSGSFVVAWYVGDKRLSTGSSGGRLSVTVPTADLAPGLHTVRLVVRDLSPYICPKSAYPELYRDHTWELRVQPNGQVLAAEPGESI